MGLLDLFTRRQKAEKQTQRIACTEQTAKPTRIETERMLVEEVSAEDMQQFTRIPYQWCGPIQKSISPNRHSFAYMDLDQQNQSIARQALQYIDSFIQESHSLSKFIPKDICIPIDQMVYHQYSAFYGYTRLMCTPYTPTGKISKYPVSLSFTTRLDSDFDETHGVLFYTVDGNISKANVNCWRKKFGFFYEFKTIGRTFVLFRIKSTVKTTSNGLPDVIYSYK